MSIHRPKEERHRWTPKEEAFLIQASTSYASTTDAAEALYQKLDQPKRCVKAKLEGLRREGRLHFGKPAEQDMKERACFYVRKLKEVMAANGYEVMMIEADKAASAVKGDRTIVLAGT